MKKIKLFLAAIAAMVGMSAFAQTDVTGTYLTNADFATGTPIDNNVCTYGKDMEANGTTYYGARVIEGWTNASVGATDEGYENCKLAGAIFKYGGTPWLAGSGTAAPTTDPEGDAGNAAGLCAVWSGSIQYTQAVTLPAGSYTVVFKVYNATSGSGNSSGVIATDLFGFVEDGGSAYYAPNNTFAIGQWSTVAVTFTLAEETTGKISMGYVSANAGNAAMPHLFVDNVKILKNKKAIDCTNKVNAQGWTGATDGYQGGTINTAREYGNKAVGRHIYQTVSGLDNGTYEVAVYSTSQKEWNGSLANDAGDVAYVFAEGAYELKEWMNARARAGYPGDENMGIYTISGVKVTDGTLTIGMGLAKADLTEWHHMQIKSLIHTNDPDLSDFVEAYENALAAAKAVDQSKKMAPSIKTALSDAIDTYDEGKVDEENADALETATEALRAATNKANTSIASYAIIESGVVRTDILDGWTCTNSNLFHINTWSVEGNPGNDPSGMTTPFIENWRNKNENAGLGEGTFSYTLEGLEPGEVYYAQALIRSYNERNSDAPNGPTFFINDSETNLATEGTTFTYNGMSGIYATLGTAATVGVDGKITLGAKIANDANYNWVAFKNVSIQPMSVALAAAVSGAEALYPSLPTAAKEDLKTVVDANKDDSSFSTADDYDTAIGNINAAKDVASSFMSPYSAWLTVKSEAETLFASYDAMLTLTASNSTAVENADDPAIITAKTAEIQNAINTYKVYSENAPVATAIGVSVTDVTTYSTVEALQEGVENLIVAEYTSAKANYPYDATALLAAWTNAPGNNHGESWNGTTGDGSDEYYDEYNKADRAMTQTVTLPKGKYVFFAKGRASENGMITMTDGVTVVTFPHKSSTGRGVATDGTATFDAGATYANSNNGRGWEYRFLAFESDGDTPITLTFNWKTASNNWAGLDDIELYTDGQSVNMVITDAKYATFVAPFDVAIPSGVTAYTVDDVAGDVLEMNEVTGGTIGANTPVVVFSESEVNITFKGVTVPVATPSAGLLVGTYERIAAPNGKYVLQNGTEGVGFYLVDTSVATPYVPANRAYLNYSRNNVKAFIFGGGEDAIKSVFGGVAAGEIYDLSGRKVAKMQKGGAYIVNGKKVIVK